MSEEAVRKRVVIIGSGISGMMSALALLQQHDISLEMTIYERRDQNEAFSGIGGIMLQENAICGVKSLSRSGKALLEKLRAQGGEIGSGGFATRLGKTLYFGESSERAKAAGHAQTNIGITRRALLPLLAETVYEAANASPNSTLEFRYGVSLENVTWENDTPTASFADGSSVTCDLLIGADGLRSKVRAAIEGRDELPEPDYSGMVCWVGTVMGTSAERIKEENLKKYTFCDYFGERQSRFGYFPAGRERLCWYAFAPRARGQEDVEDVKEVLRKEFCVEGYEFPSLVSSVIDDIPDVDGSFRHETCDREVNSDVWGKGLATLIGDSAHPIQPTTGQGACQAIEDVLTVTIKVLKAWREGGSVEKALREYEKERTPRVLRMRESARDVTAMALQTNWLLLWIRDFVLGIMPAWIADKTYLWMYTEFRPDIVE